MSPRRSAIVLWFVLALLLPLPLFVEQWGWWPLARLLHFLFSTAFDPAGVAQLLSWSLLLMIPALIYRRLATGLPPKWAGALVGLCCWVLLVLLYSAELYRDPLPSGATHSLRSLYQTAAA
jgi:hypothetical protein